MNRKEEIEIILKSFTWSESLNTYISLTAFANQIAIMNSFREQYKVKGYLSDKQIDVAKKIIEQNKSFSRMWRMSRC